MSTPHQRATPVAENSASPPEPPQRGASAVARSLLLWSASGLYFFTVCPLVILLSFFVDARKNDGPQRWLCRTTVRLAGGRVEVRRSPGFDPLRTCFLISNHVNLFDPFVLYTAVPQFLRGLELESHFRIPVYGWLMKRFGNVPVPGRNRPSDLKRMWRLTHEALDGGVSLAVFPEGTRTLTGRVGTFHNGVFRMAVEFGVPIVPVSIVGSFEFNRKTSWILRPSKIVVHLHDVIETQGLDKDDVLKLSERVRNIVTASIDAHMGTHTAAGGASAAEHSPR
jgi:1-acyl-sn-glycerol-3-phosphate acyltransferase